MEISKEKITLAARPKGLVVDDDKGWQDSFGRYLRDCGLDPTVVSSFKEANDLLDKEFFHVALVDLSLVEENNRDGLLVLNKIYADLQEGTAAILITAYGGVEEGAQANTYGAQVISKPSATYPRMLEEIPKALQIALASRRANKLGLSFLAGEGTPRDRLVWENSILQLLGCGYALADEFTARLLGTASPLLRLKNSSHPEIDKTTGILIETYWSKMLGKPFRLLLGSVSSVQSEINRLQSLPEKSARERIIDIEERAELAGVLIEMSEPPFEAFNPKASQ